ncbi:MAG: hypothetical protein C0405_13360, partial [Desulfovibrio sp.]|nr:hypothetical protein [Desulfovibrio sp.]
RDNWYDFTTSEWQASHSYYSDIFTKLPGLAGFLGANPTYGDMFTNEGSGGASAAINAYLAAQNSSGSSSSSGSTVSTTA